MEKGEPTGKSRFANLLTEIRTRLQEKEGYVIEPDNNLAESVGITVEQLKQNLEARQEFIEKSLKDYPTNEALDTLADEIDEQCK